MLLSVITEFKLGNFNQNLVAFKRWDGVKDGKFEYYVGSREGWSQKNKIKGGMIETGGLGQFANLREEAWQKKGNGLYVDYQLSPGWIFLPSIL